MGSKFLILKCKNDLVRGQESGQGRINHSGTPHQRKAGALFSYAEPGFSLGRTFLPGKVDDLFLVVVTSRPTPNVAQRLDVKTAW